MRYYIRRQGVDNPNINTKVFIPSVFFENLIALTTWLGDFEYEKINKTGIIENATKKLLYW